MRIIKVNGLTRDLPPAFGGKFLLSDIQREIGDIKLIRIPLIGGSEMIISESKQNEKNSINKAASSILTGRGDIYGDVVYKNMEDEII